MESGVTGTFHIDADSVTKDQAYFTIYGTKGILFLTDLIIKIAADPDCNEPARKKL